MNQFSKPWEELTIADNFIFCKVMENENLCIELLETLLKIKIEKIQYIKTENVIENLYDKRGIRMDVFVKDSNRIFDIEMQTGNYGDLILRSRYYLSACDVSTTKRRTQFSNLKETFIIFICKDDPFGAGIPVYTKKSRFVETDEIPYDDKVHNVFYNCSAWERESEPKVREVLKYIYGLEADSSFVSKIDDAVFYAKATPSLKDEFMFLSDVIEEEKEIAREEGLAEGRAKGLAEGRAKGREAGIQENRIENAKKMLQLGLDYDTIYKVTGVTKEQLNKTDCLCN